jgi:hypothetical protein
MLYKGSVAFGFYSTMSRAISRDKLLMYHVARAGGVRMPDTLLYDDANVSRPFVPLHARLNRVRTGRRGGGVRQQCGPRCHQAAARCAGAARSKRCITARPFAQARTAMVCSRA